MSADNVKPEETFVPDPPKYGRFPKEEIPALIEASGLKKGKVYDVLWALADLGYLVVKDSEEEEEEEVVAEVYPSTQKQLAKQAHEIRSAVGDVLPNDGLKQAPVRVRPIVGHGS